MSVAGLLLTGFVAGCDSGLVEEPNLNTVSGALLSADVTNGSFETGNHSGWTLQESPEIPTFGTFAVLANGQTVELFGVLHDEADDVDVQQFSPGLPRVYNSSDGNFLSINLQNGPQNHRMFQDVELGARTETLVWDLEYRNHLQFFDDQIQFVAVNIRDTSDNILATVFKTQEGVHPQAIPMTTFTADISAFAGQTVRIDFEYQVQGFFFDVAVDHIFIVAANTPPGWQRGKKRGWDGTRPPGLDRRNAIPPGFDRGLKNGWN